MTSPLILPEPAGRLYQSTREVLEELLPTVIDDERGWWLGGGTVLAAQWQHRLSTDLDIFLPASTSLAPFDPRWAPDFRDAMARLGATRMEIQQRSIKTWFPKGRLEITALDPVPALPPRKVNIDGHEAHVLENASIMCGKLFGRGRRLPERDIFDICVAAEEDVDALRCAVNHLGPDARREIVHLLEIGADGFRASAPDVVLEPAARYAHLLQEAPAYAATIIRDETYESTHIAHTSTRTVTVQARTVGGQMVSRRYTSGEALAEGMLRMGLEEEMLARHGTRRAFVEHANAQMVSSSGDGPPQAVPQGGAGT